MRKLFFLVIVPIFAVIACTNNVETVYRDTHIKNHRFSPDVIKIKENQLLKLTVYNDDPTVEEFESFDFKREKIVPGNGKIIVMVGPLKKGSYEFFGEFHMDSAKGRLIVE